MFIEIIVCIRLANDLIAVHSLQRGIDAAQVSLVFADG